MLTCRRCLVDKPEESFSKKTKSKRGYSYICKDCHNEYNRTQWYKKNADKQKASSLTWKRANRIKVLATKYKCEEELLQELFEKTGGQCTICKSEDNLVVDHCHTTQDVRGLICGNCNKALGFVKDNPEVLRNMINYLETTGGVV